MKKSFLYILIVIAMIFAFVSCASPAANQPASQQVPAAQPTPTKDLCAPENIKGEIEKITVAQRDFDDISFLAQSTPQNQAAVVILELQRYRKVALDQKAPACLKALKENQIKYMTSVVATMMNFMVPGKTDLVSQQLTITRELRVNYDAELARLLGVKYETPTPLPTQAPTAVPSEATPVALLITTEQDINIFQGPGVDYPVAGNFLVGQTAYAFTRTEKNDWVQVQLADKPEIQGWAAVHLIKINGDINALPVAPK